MKVLDYWSGGTAHAFCNWRNRNWGWVTQQLTGEAISEVTCYDPLCIAGDTTIGTLPETVFHFTSCIDTIISDRKYGAICLLHPNPTTSAERRVLSGDEGFHTNRYLPVVAQIIEKVLNPGGHVIVQFDDQIREYPAKEGSGADVFLQRLQKYTDGQLVLQKSRAITPNCFPSDTYQFDSLHILRKAQ